MIFAYFGPDTVLPLTSTLAAVVGVALMFGKQTFRLAGLCAVSALRPFRKAPAPGPIPVRARPETLRPGAAGRATPLPHEHAHDTQTGAARRAEA